MAVQNPLVGLFGSFLWTAALTPLLSLPVLLFFVLGLPQEVPLFYRIAAFAIAGALAGRTGTFGWAALPTSFLGGFVGYVVFGVLLEPPVDLGFAAIHATVAGLAGWASATSLMARLTPEVRLENEEKRRCRMCGARVGSKARRCWSCRASLNRIS